MKLFRTLTIFVSFAVAGCAGSQINSEPSVANGLASRSVTRGLATLTQRVNPDKAASFKKALYVAEDDSDAIKIFSNNRYRELGVITNGISSPAGLSMDRRGNLYVANGGAGDDVTEYAPGGTSPFFTYDANMSTPQNVTVDSHDNVFEADADGYINQYFQGLNTVTASCPAPYGTDYPTAVAVDSTGDVFVSYYAVQGSGGGLYEYVGGLKYCTPMHLGAMGNTSTPGLALDADNNLIATADTTEYGGIDVIAPPYSTITRTIGNYSYLTDASLNKKNKLLFAAHWRFGGDVLVYNYQTGDLVKKLGTPYGITHAFAVVDGPNAVY